MVTDKELLKLYSQRILELAADIPHTVRLENPDAVASVRSPLCGSVITVDIMLDDGRVSQFGQDVKACALGQAAASVVGANVLGRSRGEIQLGTCQLRAMLTSGGPPPSRPFQDLSVLEPAREFKNRHASIMLALEATLAAFDKATELQAAT